jgi:DNA-binding response OmpR family regulator
MLLDLELPGTDGLEVCRAVRDGSDIPLISVTEHTGEVDQVLALQAGCDDCLVKPIGLRELEARMAAVMRRARAQATQAPAASKVAHGPLALDSCAREARLHGRPVELTRKEFDLLFLLASQPATVVSRKDAMAKVWGYVWPTRSRTIDMHVSSLRKKLGATSWIVTVHGVGFRLGSP